VGVAEAEEMIAERCSTLNLGSSVVAAASKLLLFKMISTGSKLHKPQVARPILVTHTSCRLSSFDPQRHVERCAYTKLKPGHRHQTKLARADRSLSIYRDYRGRISMSFGISDPNQAHSCRHLAVIPLAS